MTQTQHAMLYLAEERGCVCEICNIGIWLKQMKQQQSIPAYLVLYHRDGNKENYNLQNIALRCQYCSQFSNLERKAFLEPPPKIKKMNHSLTGTVWFNNGLMSKIVMPHEIPLFERMGWERGRIRTYREPPSTKGTIMITNGIKNKVALPNDPIPAGWWRGMTKHGYRIRTSDYRRAQLDSCQSDHQQ